MDCKNLYVLTVELRGTEVMQPSFAIETNPFLAHPNLDSSQCTSVIPVVSGIQAGILSVRVCSPYD